MVTDNDGNCDLSFMRIDLPREYGPGMLMGEVFMRHFFTTFKRETTDSNGVKTPPMVGFASAKSGPEPMKRLDELTGSADVKFSSGSAQDEA